MSSISYHQIGTLPFYSLNQFTQLQPISRGKSAIYLYQHNESKEVFVVKEAPYREDRLKVYQKLISLHGVEGIVRIRGLCKMVIKYKKHKKGTVRNHEVSEQELVIGKQSKTEGKIAFKQKQDKTGKQNSKQEQWFLLFMQKCDENMVDYISLRVKEKKPFKIQEVTSFINQMLLLLQILEKSDICHRDIKPENFLHHKGRFKLCDFQNSMFLDPLLPVEKRYEVDLTTIEYTSPQFFRNLRETKPKIFDPFKLDLYAFGITILYLCSMGKFNLSQRRQYLQENSSFHSNFMKEQRRRHLKNNDEFKSLSTIVKIMLEQDEYKRDTFVTLLIKIKPIFNLRELEINVFQQEAFSENSKSEQSRRKLAQGSRKSNRKGKWQGSSEMQKKSVKSLLILVFLFFILLVII